MLRTGPQRELRPQMLALRSDARCHTVPPGDIWHLKRPPGTKIRRVICGFSFFIASEGSVITVHGVHGFKRHYFRRLGVGALQQLLQVLAIVVAEDDAFGSAVPDALNHRGVVPRVRVDLTPWAGSKGTIKDRHLSSLTCRSEVSAYPGAF